MIHTLVALVPAHLALGASLSKQFTCQQKRCQDGSNPIQVHIYHPLQHWERQYVRAVNCRVWIEVFGRCGCLFIATAAIDTLLTIAAPESSSSTDNHSEAQYCVKQKETAAYRLPEGEIKLLLAITN